MSNHWHFVLWPERDDHLAAFLRWLTHTHTQRWHAHYYTIGTGHLYQGRFKAFPIQEDEHLLTVPRYVERNPLRAGLVTRAADWPWSSLRGRRAGLDKIALHPGPAPRPSRWQAYVNLVETEGE
jgi:putative transposase